MIKICPICNISSKALHMHMKKHKKDTGFVQTPEEVLMSNEIPLVNPEVLKNGLIGGDVIITDEVVNTPIEPVEELKNENNCEYRLTMHFNNQKFDCFTNNLKISMLSYRPEQVLTEGYIKIQRGQSTFERKYPLVELKKILQDDERLDLFLNSLILG